VRTSGWCKYLSFMLLGVFVLALSLPMAGQERFGNITGIVTDPSGAVVADVTVTIVNKSTNRTLTSKTRSDGTYSAFEIEPGRYSVMFQKQGFGRYEVPDVIVLVGRTANISAQMKLGSVDQTVEVVETAPLIDTTSTMIATNVTAEEIEHLPKPRTFQAIANFSPSVNTGVIEGGFQVNGASAAENAYYIDGVATNSVVDGSARQSATFDYIQEVQVKTTGLDAEFGGALGGVVSAITKSGGNAFHGDAHYFYYGSKLSAAPPERLTLDPTTGTDVAYFQDRKGKRNSNEIGGSFGGPLVKDRLWFYTAASPRWTSRRLDYQFFKEQSEITGRPIFESGDMNRSFHKMNWFNKLSWNPVDRIRTNFTWLYTPEYQTGSLYGYDEWGINATSSTKADAFADSRRGYNQAENSITGQVDLTLTNSSFISIKGGRYFLNYKETGVPTSGSYWWQLTPNITTIDPTLQFDEDLQRSQGTTTPSGAITASDKTTRTYIQSDMSQLFNFGGQHNIKFGAGTQKVVNNINDLWYGADGRVDLYLALDNPATVDNPATPNVIENLEGNCAVCASASGNLVMKGTYGFYAVQTGGTVGTAGSNVTNLYVQDSWKLHRRLTINAGVRIEKETIPSFRPEVQKYAIQFGFGDKIAPRVGASFDLLGNGKVKLSAGWGRYFDWTKYDLPRGTFGADAWHTYYRAIDTLDPNVLLNLNANNMPGTNLWPAEFRDRRLPGFQYLDPDVKPMSSDSMHAGMEWEVLNNMVFSGRYVRSKLRRTIEDMGVLVDGSEQYFYGNPGEGANTITPASGGTCMVDLGVDEDGNPLCGIPMPKAQRQYDAMELQLTRRFGQGWLASASYVYSRLYGNYSGLQSSDEIRPATLGYSSGAAQQFAGNLYRSGGNANRYFDLDEALFDANGNLGLIGRLPTDRPHVVKLYGAKQFKFGTDVGAFFRAMSGTPVTTQVNTVNGIPVYVEGRGDMGRTPFFNQTDLVVGHTFKVAEKKDLRFEMNMINLFNQKTAQYVFDRYNREEHSDTTGIDLVDVDLAQGFDWQAAVAASGNDLDPRYGMDSDFASGFEARFLVKFTF
jgi:hypothetical protein